MQVLLREISACRLCEDKLPLGPRPVVSAHPEARILLVGQAPGTRVHASGVPWDDPSGDRLRRWLHIEKAVFYDPKVFAIVPMGFCYPGKGKSGDLPPRPECAPTWHERLLAAMPHIQLTLLIGRYAQEYYLKKAFPGSLTAAVQHYRDFLPQYLPLPHPSPRNVAWFKRNPWFEEELLPVLREKVQRAIAG
jgi:uracil-DNA glycosylase